MRTGLLLLFIFMSVFSQARIGEIRVSDDGQLKAIVIKVEQYEIIVSQMGIIEKIELIAKDSTFSGFRIEKGYIAKNENKNETIDFNDGKISSIGSVSVLYNLGQKDRIDEIGRIEFIYNTVDDETFECHACHSASLRTINNRMTAALLRTPQTQIALPTAIRYNDSGIGRALFFTYIAICTPLAATYAENAQS